MSLPYILLPKLNLPIFLACFRYMYVTIYADMEDPNKSLEYLKQLEKCGADILRDKDEIVALDKRRNESREGMRALENSKQDKAFFALGPMLIKMPSSQVKELLKKDSQQVDIEINKLRSNLKQKVNKLRDMEHQPPVPGLNLKAMNSAELHALGRL